MNRRQMLRTLALGVAALPVARGGLQAQTPAPTKPAAGATGTTGATSAAAPPAPTGPFVLPPLGYAFDALEPHLDALTMQIHHDKHHAAYVANLNKAVAGRAELSGWSVERLVKDLDKVPSEIRSAVRNHGGGHSNHSLLWKSLRKDGVHAPAGELAKAVDQAFGSFAAFTDKFNAAALGVFGSGWAWLTADAKGVLGIETAPNQDSPLTAGRAPIVGIDVWEHAYYLKFQNRRAEYITAFANVIDWDAVSARYRDTIKG